MRWGFKIKLKPDGSVAEHKARFVAIGFLQKFSLYYFEVFEPIARHETQTLVISISKNKNWPLIYLDVKLDFLNGKLHEELYVLQPPGFVKENKEGMVYNLHKALYRLKQAPRFGI